MSKKKKHSFIPVTSEMLGTAANLKEALICMKKNLQKISKPNRKVCFVSPKEYKRLSKEWDEDLN